MKPKMYPLTAKQLSWPFVVRDTFALGPPKCRRTEHPHIPGGHKRVLPYLGTIVSSTSVFLKLYPLSVYGPPVLSITRHITDHAYQTQLFRFLFQAFTTFLKIHF